MTRFARQIVVKQVCNSTPTFQITGHVALWPYC